MQTPATRVDIDSHDHGVRVAPDCMLPGWHGSVRVTDGSGLVMGPDFRDLYFADSDLYGVFHYTPG